MRILYLSRNMGNYKSAMYQRQVMDELTRKVDVVFYGPGFPLYNIQDSIQDIFIKINGKPDCIIVGHAWLVDQDGVNIDPHVNLELNSCDVPKAVILNKEYVNLNQKLDWIKNRDFSIAFTHHHNIDYFQEITGVKFIFLPFAFDEHLINITESGIKDIDFSFSGILQNRNRDTVQTDTRIRIMRKLFVCINDIPIMKRFKYSKFRIFWNSIPRSRWQYKLASLLSIYRYLPDNQYILMQKRSKIFLNTLSPAGLVGPRFAENMACRALVFCEESKNYENIFPPDCFVLFKHDLSDFEEKLLYYLNNEFARKEITEKAFKEAINNHTWSIRINKMLYEINSIC
jgi:spore maturation protein CgeB